jgi:hypothetical protein
LTDKGHIQFITSDLVSNFLNIKDYPETGKYLEFITKHADEFYSADEQKQLSNLFVSIVPEQTAEQFKDFLNNLTITDDALTYIVNPSILDDAFFMYLSKCKSGQWAEWADKEETYIDYLQKQLVYIDHIKDKSLINSDFFYYIQHDMENCNDGIDNKLVSLLKQYFNKLDSLNLFEIDKLDDDTKQFLVKIGIINEIKTYKLASSHI